MSRGRRISRVKFIPPTEEEAAKYLLEWDQKTLAAIRSGELTHLDLATQHQHLTRMSRQLANGAPYEPAYRDEAAESVIDMLKEALGKNKDGK